MLELMKNSTCYASLASAFSALPHLKASVSTSFVPTDVTYSSETRLGRFFHRILSPQESPLTTSAVANLEALSIKLQDGSLDPTDVDKIQKGVAESYLKNPLDSILAADQNAAIQLNVKHVNEGWKDGLFKIVKIPSAQNIVHAQSYGTEFSSGNFWVLYARENNNTGKWVHVCPFTAGDEAAARNSLIADTAVKAHKWFFESSGRAELAEKTQTIDVKNPKDRYQSTYPGFEVPAGAVPLPLLYDKLKNQSPFKSSQEAQFMYQQLIDRVIGFAQESGYLISDLSNPWNLGFIQNQNGGWEIIPIDTKVFREIPHKKVTQAHIVELLAELHSSIDSKNTKVAEVLEQAFQGIINDMAQGKGTLGQLFTSYSEFDGSILPSRLLGPSGENMVIGARSISEIAANTLPPQLPLIPINPTVPRLPSTIVPLTQAEAQALSTFLNSAPEGFYPNSAKNILNSIGSIGLSIFIDYITNKNNNGIELSPFSIENNAGIKPQEVTKKIPRPG